MEIVLTASDRMALEQAKAAEPRLRRWRRYQAVLLLAAGQSPGTVATALGCAVSSVYNWAAAWHREGLPGLQEGDHGGGQPVLDAAGAALVVDLLEQDPQTLGHHATGWTVSLLRTELRPRGYAPSDRTLRRVLHRLGYRWKRPKFVLGRPDPAAAEKRGP
jgi:transposase